MAKNLVIVESPAKAKTIEKYLGKDYTVASSYGHVRDLPKGDNAIDIENGFKPTYEISKDKVSVIKALKSMAKTADMIYLASDDDREGEAISWHLKEALDLKDAKTRRIVFREITKNAILNAIKNPRGIDLDLVNAQQARRVLDRLVGFELSPILWKKIKTGLSAGRVQSVAVRLIVEREREIEKFEPGISFKVTAEFDLGNGKLLQAELPSKFKTEEEAAKFLEKCNGAEFTIRSLETKPGIRTPAPPFTTSTLQQEASRKLGFSVSQTMTVAQRLYENGYISYMRTDSVNLSQEAMNAASAEISAAYGQNYVKTRAYKNKSQNAQEAHEAIRPTNFGEKSLGANRNEQNLYELIWKRAIASQMADASIEKTIATIGISTIPETLTAQGEMITFDGFLKVYMESSDEEEDNGLPTKGVLPPLTVGQQLLLKRMKSRQGFSRAPARYTEASLVKKLEEMGIGRPSTYAPTISTIQKRDYVVKENREGVERSYREILLENGRITSKTNTEITGAEKNKLFPTNTAMVVNDFLTEHFDNIVDYSFTARVEKEFDEIARGGKAWDQMIDAFYERFHPKVEKTESLERAEVRGSRELGTDPESGKPVYVKLGKFGAYVQIGENPKDENDTKPRYASLKKGQLMENINLEEALELFRLPRPVGYFEDSDITAAIGKFGPYLKHDGKFVSIPKDEDPLSISEHRAIELILEKRKQEAEKYIKTFPENDSVMVLNGRYGPYIKVGKKNVKIPKGKVPAELSLEECLELAEKAPERKGGKQTRKK